MASLATVGSSLAQGPAPRPSSPLAKSHVAVSIKESRSLSSFADTHPTFREALAARMEGAAPIQAVQAATDLVCSVLTAVAMGHDVGAEVAQSAVQSGLQFGLDTAFHVGVTAVTQTKTVQAFGDRFASENATKEDALNRMRALSALLSVGTGITGQLALPEAASTILHQAQSGAGLALGLAKGMVATGVLSAGTLTLYRTNSAFRKQLDTHLESMYGLVANLLESSPSGDRPPSFEQADAMEKGQAGTFANESARAP
jgi:hypothetical protein